MDAHPSADSPLGGGSTLCLKRVRPRARRSATLRGAAAGGPGVAGRGQPGGQPGGAGRRVRGGGAPYTPATPSGSGCFEEDVAGVVGPSGPVRAGRGPAFWVKGVSMAKSALERREMFRLR